MSITRTLSLSAAVPLLVAGVIAAGGSHAAGPKNELVAHYCLNSTTSTDCSSRGNNGVATGAVSLVPGILGTAAKFGGYRDLGYVIIPASPSLAFGNNFTVSYWARFDDFAGEDAFANFVPYAIQMAVAKSHDRQGFLSYIASAPEPALGSVGFIDYSTAVALTTPIKLQLGKWLHVTITQRSNPERLRLYVDGALQQTIENGHHNFALSNGQPLYLGAQSPLFGERTYRYPLAGTLDEVRIYNRDLAAIEVFPTVLSDRYGIKD